MSKPQVAAGGSLVLEKREDGVATLTLNRPQNLNALNNDLATAFNSALSRIDADDDVLVLVVTGMGRGFCSGGDLNEIAKGRESGDGTELEPLLRSGMQAVLTLRTMHQPVIAAVNGAAAGAGMNIALAADIRIASDTATFGQNFVKVGLFPDYGGTYFLPELVGPSRAAEMFYTGDMIDAQTALSIGVVNRVVPAAQLEAETKALALKIAQGPPVVMRSVKRAMFGGARAKLAKALQREVDEQMKCFLSDDCHEGIRAFLEKRKAKFQGK